ncbi:MAG: CSN-associated deubiquitinating enzyme Ubp12 [Bogoriella megaspora]|nr:MAG: CSN-associated deubiquitinating enzyme Ubp12 [Bogoriella megaspora]
MLRVQQIQQDHNERLLRLERRQEDDARIKSVWGSTTSFPSVLSGTPHQTPLHHPQNDAFSGFDDEQNMIGSLHLDTDNEPRRGGATSRANSVRFDESANQGHWGSRSSIDIIPRTGSSLGGLALTERTASYKSEGKQSSGGQSVHSATSGRANSLGLDTQLTLGQSAASYPGTPGLAPGLFILGSVPSIIRCWLDMNFKHENLLYAAVCTGSYKSFLDLRLVEKLGFSGLVKENDNGNRSIRLPMYLPEAIAHPPSSRSSSPAPHLPTVTIEFSVVDRGTEEAESKAIQIFLGSDTLRTHSADILFSSNQLILFDDDRGKLTIPLVRPENDATFKSLFISSGDPSRTRREDSQQSLASLAPGERTQQSSSLPMSPTPTSSQRDTSPSEKAQESAASTTDMDSPRIEGMEPVTEEDTPTPSATRTTPAQRPSLGILTSKPEERPAESANSVAATPPRSGSVGSPGIWSNWRRDSSSTNQMDWANAGKSPNPNYQRRDTGIKVLKPTRPATRTFSNSTVTATPSPVTSQSRFFDEGRRKPTSESNGASSQLRRMASMEGRSEGGSKESSVPQKEKAKTSNPVGLPPITASYKKRKLGQDLHAERHVPGDSKLHQHLDDLTQPTSHASSNISTSPNSQRSTQSPPRYIPSHLQDEVLESSIQANSSHISAASTTGSSPTDAYANLTLGGDTQAAMTARQTQEEQDTTQEGSAESPITPTQTRTSASQLAQAENNVRASSPAKRSAETMEGGDDTAKRNEMEVDEPPSYQSVLEGTAGDIPVGEGLPDVASVNTQPNGIRAASVDMLGDTQSDTQPASATDSEAASSGRQTATPATSASSSTHTTMERDNVGAPHTRNAIPSYDEQVNRIYAMLSNEEKKEGLKGYLISSSWLQRVMARTTENQKSSEYQKSDREGEIGPVDNSDIVVETNRSIKDAGGDDFIPLKPGMLSQEDFEIVPEQAWNQIIAWYGLAPGSPVLVRYMHDTSPQGSAQSNLMYELFPPMFTVCKVGNDTDTFAGLREPAVDAPLLVASRNEGVQNFLRRVKTALKIDMNVKVQLWRILQPQETANAEVSSGLAGILTPASSRNASPAPAAPSVAVRAPKIIMDTPTFSNMAEGTEREMIDIKDETTNEKYNGRSQLETVGLATNQYIIVEEQIGGPAGGEWLSDNARIKNKRSPLNSRNKNNGLLGAKSKGINSGRTSPAPTGPVTRGRTRQSGRTRGTVGLTNLGNTCYMNSALQCMRSVEELSMYFMTERYKDELNTNNPLGYNGEIAKTYASFIASVFGDSAGSFTPRQIKGVIGKCQPLFSGYGQQDSQEFLSFLLDAIHEDLNRIHKKPYMENPESDDKTVNDTEAIKALGERFRENHRKRNDSVAMDLFSGFYKNTMVCPDCGKVSITFDPYSLVTLQLPIQSSWQHTVTFAPLHSTPIQVQVDVEKYSTIKILKEYIAKKVSGLDPKKLVVAEVYSKKFFKLYDDDKATVESIQANDIIVVYEVDDVPTNYPSPEPKQKKSIALSYYNSPSTDEEITEDSPLADRMLVPIFHRQPMQSTSRYGSTRSMTLWPSFILITREEAKDYDEILRKVIAKIATMTTRPILTEDDDGFGIASLSNSGSEAVTTNEEDASSMNGQKVNAQSVDSEDGMVDVTMTEDTQKKTTADADIDMNEADSTTTKSLPEVLKPGAYIPPQLQSLFEMKIYRSGSDLVPTGWNSITDNKEYPTVQSRVPPPIRRMSVQSRTSRTSARSAKSGLDDEPNSSSSDEDIDAPLPSNNNNLNMSFENGGSDSEDLPDTTTFLTQRFGAGKNQKRNRKMKTYSSKGKRATRNKNAFASFDGATDTGVTEGLLVKPHEGLILDWAPEQHESLFGGTSIDDLRGHCTFDSPPVLPDPELDAKKSARAARKKHGVTLEECFAETAKSEILSEENAWYCNRCKELRRASKTLEIWTAPDILVLHLKRFGQARGFRDKVEVLVDYPVEGLDLAGKVGLPEGKGLVYDLIAVDNHYGGLGGGHYTAYAKNFYDDKWYDYNDSIVSSTAPQTVVSSSAYLLFYRRRSSTPLGGPILADLVTSLHNNNSSSSEDDDNQQQLQVPNTTTTVNNNTNTTTPHHHSASPSPLDHRLVSPAGPGRETQVASGTAPTPSSTTTTSGIGVGAVGLRGGSGTGGGGSVHGARPPDGGDIDMSPWEEEQEDEGIHIDEGDDLPPLEPVSSSQHQQHNLYGPPKWDFANLTATRREEEVTVEEGDADAAGSDVAAGGSDPGNELQMRMMEDFGEEEEEGDAGAHPGFGTPVRREGTDEDEDEEMLLDGEGEGVVKHLDVMPLLAGSEDDAPAVEVRVGEDEESEGKGGR